MQPVSLRVLALATVFATVAACSATSDAFVVGGVVQGLTGVVVLANGAETIAIEAGVLDASGLPTDVRFAFVASYSKGTAYDVTVKTQPTGQHCAASGSSGTIDDENIATVVVTCATLDVEPTGPLPAKVGGTVTGLVGEVVLANNGGDALRVDADGPFAFSTSVANGASYAVTVAVQPADGHCDVANGTGTITGSNVTNVTVTCSPNPPTTTTLALSVSDLALSVTGIVEYGVAGTPLSGTARTLTVTNTGTIAATNLTVTAPAWPAGTTSSTTCGATLAANASCTVTVTPGSTASSDGTAACSTGTAPIPHSLSVAADNGNTVTSNVVVLNYGCIYQGGFVFAFDDTTPSTGSVGGEVMSIVDQAAPYPDGIIWSSDTSGSYDSGVAVYGIDETSTVSTPSPSAGLLAGQAACNGGTDGACNTNNIHVIYPTTNASFYAAGLCTQSIAAFSDWHLPAICELGYDANGGAGCGNVAVPVRQNIQSALVEFNALNLVQGNYWSSTEAAGGPRTNAFYHLFVSGSSSGAQPGTKGTHIGVRCARAF